MNRQLRNALLGNPVQHRRRRPGQSGAGVTQCQFADDVVLRPAYITRDGGDRRGNLAGQIRIARPINAIPFRWASAVSFESPPPPTPSREGRGKHCGFSLPLGRGKRADAVGAKTR